MRTTKSVAQISFTPTHSFSAESQYIMKILITLFMLLFLSELRAEGIYICSMPNGSREYRNTGDVKGCKKLNVEAVSVIPSGSGGNASGDRSKNSAAPDGSFARIDNMIQKRRDQDRMQILLDEVKREESRLIELKQEYQNGEPERLGSERNYAKYLERVAQLKEDIQRSEKNIEALKREISTLK